MAAVTFKRGDTVVQRGGKRGLRWRVTEVWPRGHTLHGFVKCERNSPGTPGYRKGGHRTPIVAIYKTETWRRVS